MLTRKGIDAMYKAYKRRRKKRRGASDDEAESSADESRAEPGTGEPRVGKRHEEGGDLNREPTMARTIWRTRHQTTQGRRR